jgi:hypothetical protein
LHYANKDAKTKRLKNEEYEKELIEREKRVKEFETAAKKANEDKLLNDKKYEDLIEALRAERDEISKAISEKDNLIETLSAKQKKIREGQQRSIDSKINLLSKDDKAIFETAAESMGDNLDGQLLLLDKLLAKKKNESVSKIPAGGREGGSSIMSAEEMAQLKNSNPELYRIKLKEIAKSI